MSGSYGDGVASGSGVKAPPRPHSGWSHSQSGEDAVTINPQDFCDKQSSMAGVGVTDFCMC